MKLIAVALVAVPLFAQDEVRIASPDGQVEFRTGVGQPAAETALPGLAYQIYYRGKMLLETSYMGYDVLNQEPLLGEKVGLSASKTGKGDGYNSMYAEYLQNGSLGRRINVEARAFNDGVAFRYVIPPSAPLTTIEFRNEYTEFRFTREGEVGHTKLTDISPEMRLDLPFTMELAGGPWVSITEAGAKSGGGMSLRHYEGHILVVRLPRLADQPQLAVQDHATWTSPWRVVTVGESANSVRQAALAKRLP